MQAANEAIQGRMKPLSQQEAAAALLRFLEASAEVFGGKGLEFIARCCRSAADVASLEGALRAGIKAWQHEEPGDRFATSYSEALGCYEQPQVDCRPEAGQCRFAHLLSHFGTNSKAQYLLEVVNPVEQDSEKSCSHRQSKARTTGYEFCCRVS